MLSLNESVNQILWKAINDANKDNRNTTITAKKNEKRHTCVN